MSKNILIAGASGAIGRAFVEAYLQEPSVEAIYALARSAVHFDDPRVISLPFDLTDEASIAQAMAQIEVPLDTAMITTGILHDQDIRPEKTIQSLNLDQLEQVFKINTFGPALMIKALLPKMRQDAPSTLAALSARVGSIGDNRLGGWYAYRASKSALNMIIKTASIEAKFKYPKTKIVGLHPGTVDSNLSKPFQSRVPEGKLFTPKVSAAHLIKVLSELDDQSSGELFAWDGERIEH